MGKLIDADALIFDLKTSFMPQSMDYTNALAIALRWLREAPALDPESLRPKGRWIDPKWNSMWQSMTATCSNCHERGEVRVKTNERGYKIINSPSCPQCGAKMENDNGKTD